MSYTQEQNTDIIEGILGRDIHTMIGGKVKSESYDLIRRVLQVIDEQDMVDFEDVVEKAEMKGF